MITKIWEGITIYVDSETHFLWKLWIKCLQSCESHIKKKSLKCKLLINMQLYIWICCIKRLTEYVKNIILIFLIHRKISFSKERLWEIFGFLKQRFFSMTFHFVNFFFSAGKILIFILHTNIYLFKILEGIICMHAYRLHKK